jgi:hypothetical protein
MKTLVGETRAQAWLAACEALDFAQERIYNLIVEVSSPSQATPISTAIEKRVDEFLIKHDRQPLNSVAETIFPATEYKLRGLQGVYDYPNSIYPAIRSASPWGNYALRLTQRIGADGKTIQPLRLLIEKAQRQIATKSPKYAAYELDLGLEAMELALYDPEKDQSNVIGGQCLSHISIKLGPRPNYAVYLTALYRYQYFTQKALGNLLGLARLQACIARELHRPIGPLVCHATLAVLESKGIDNNASWSKSEVRELLEESKASAAEAESQLV